MSATTTTTAVFAVLAVLVLVSHTQARKHTPHSVSTATPTFTIENDRFVKDGETFLIFSGCIHYSRVHPGYWKDRLMRLRAMGLNAIETYVPWNFHNPAPGDYRFTGAADLPAFLQAAKDVGLLVLLRAGPYMCGEWEFGGFPAFLLNITGIEIRTYNNQYIAEVDKWWNTLLPLVKPFLYENGGPIVMMQVENEFGSYGNVMTNPADKQYMEHLVSLARANLGNNLILYTTDGGDTGYMSRGTLPGEVFTVGDFGPGSDPASSFNAQKQFNAPGKSANMCTEFYTGWLTHWGEGMANTSSQGVAKGIQSMIALNGSFSLYMGHGGTNFGFWSGANGGGGTSFQPHITSYDYDSPISEAGTHGYGSDRQDKYSAIQTVLLAQPQTKLNPPPAEPAVNPLIGNGAISMSEAVDFMPSISVLSTGAYLTTNPEPQEFYGQAYGFTLYRNLVTNKTASLQINDVRDRALVFVDSEYVGTTYRCSPSTLTLPATSGVLDILVENMGRINYGHGMTDPKGIVGKVLVNGTALTEWTVLTIPLEPEQVARLSFSPVTGTYSYPTFFKATFTAGARNGDQYLNMRGWGKGIVWFNGVNIGRYWESQGPQHALYVPAFLQDAQSKNEIIILELESAPKLLTIQSTSAPDFGGKQNVESSFQRV